MLSIFNKLKSNYYVWYGDQVALRELVKIVPDHKSGLLQLGRAQMEMGRDESALEHLEEALRLDPESQVVKKTLCQAHSNRSTAFGRIKNQKQSEHHFHEAMKIIPDFGPAHLSMGICYTELGRYKDALAKIKEALKLDKNLAVEANYRFEEVYTKLKDNRKAIKHYKGSHLSGPFRRPAQPEIGDALLQTEKI